MLVNLNDVLHKAQKEHYAVGLFNTTDTTMLEAVIAAAEELRSPVIIGTAEVLLPLGELDLMGPAMIAAAKKASVPVVVHFDHGLTLERCKQALALGFTSVMFDGSAAGVEQNISQTAQIVTLAHSVGATVEGEIGHVGDETDNTEPSADGYTTPEEAADFVKRTGVDALAVAIGTVHGTYRHTPKLDIERLEQIRAVVDTPLVLHGGSGLSDADFYNTINAGVTKVNIYTDLCNGVMEGMRQGVCQKLSYADTHLLMASAVKEEAKSKMRLFGSAGKA